MTAGLFCRFCRAPLQDTVVDLGLSPVANDYVPLAKANEPEVFYPLHVYVCRKCWLVQLPNVIQREKIFNDRYAYFSSYSASWLEHAKNYVEHIIPLLKLGPKSLVVELASNDGYLLRFFRDKTIPVLGVEPSANVAAAAKKIGIRTVVKFFGKKTARELAPRFGRADLIIGNNVMAHVPDLNDFVGGMKLLLKKTGTITIEFPHLFQMIKHHEFDTIYHEHYSYFSLLSAAKIFRAHGLTIYNVERLLTHGGSLRIYAANSGAKPIQPAVARLIRAEAGLKQMATYRRFAREIDTIKLDLLRFLLRAKAEGKTVAAYGAPAKGNTLLNYCGVRPDLIAFTVDKSPAKQHHLLPGTRIPILDPAKIALSKPDYLLILPWNLKTEIMAQMAGIKKWGGRFVVPIPRLEVI